MIPRMRLAFSLIEILVVIALIFIVAAFLYPIVGHARSRARQTARPRTMRTATTPGEIRSGPWRTMQSAVRPPISGSRTIAIEEKRSYGSSPNGSVSRIAGTWVVAVQSAT